MNAVASPLRGPAIAALIAAFAVAPAAAQTAPQPTPVNESGQIVLTLENHIFTPAEIHVRAGQKTQILLKNLDATAEEFDSTTLKVEKVIAGHSEGVLRLRALEPGSYPFVGEYNSAIAKGQVIAD
jgi:Cupredoxin-like domain